MRSLVAGALALALLAGACNDGGGSDTTTEGPTDLTPQAGGKVIFGLSGESDGFLPSENRFSPSTTTVAKAIYDPLAAWGTDDQVYPYLAESFVPNEDFTSWEVTVREGIVFHDGTPLDAEALRVNLQASKDSGLVGLALRPIDTIEVTGPRTVTVTMNRPWSRYPTVLAGQAGMVAAPAQIEAKDSRRPVGTGPFVFQSWAPDSSLKVNRNANYWRTDDAGNRLPYLDSVEFRPLPDNTSRTGALSTADVDVIHTNAADDFVRFVTEENPPRGSRALVDDGEGDEFSVILNTQSGPLANLEVRRALQLGTDRQQLVDSLFQGAFAVADGPYSQSSPWWSDSGWPEPDKAEAQRIVDEYKAANGITGDLVIAVKGVAAPQMLLLGQALQAQWEEFGVRLDLETLEESTFAGVLVGGEWDAVLLPFFNQPDPDGEYHFWSADGIGAPGAISLNFPRYTSDTVQEALDFGRTSGDDAARKEAYGRIWRDWAENVPYLWLFHSPWIVVAQDDVQGITDITLPDGQPAQPIVWGSVFLTTAWVGR